MEDSSSRSFFTISGLTPSCSITQYTNREPYCTNLVDQYGGVWHQFTISIRPTVFVRYEQNLQIRSLPAVLSASFNMLATTSFLAAILLFWLSEDPLPVGSVARRPARQSLDITSIGSRTSTRPRSCTCNKFQA